MIIREESHMVYCPDCGGSGEGQTDGSICLRCHGQGTIYPDDAWDWEPPE